MCQHAKNQFIPFVHSSDRVNFRVPSHDWPHPFLTTPTNKIFNVFLTFKRQSHKLVKHTQNICQQFADELFECV